jgi:ferredoxin
MRVRVAPEACIGSGNCARTAPETFGQNDVDGVVVLLDAAPPAYREAAVRAAADQCPVAAITVDGPA